MSILLNAIAYKQDFQEREPWTNCHTASIPVGCPRGCTIEYDLIVSVLATEEEIAKWIETLHARMERVCPSHEETIYF